MKNNFILYIKVRDHKKIVQVHTVVAANIGLKRPKNIMENIHDRRKST